ncbi:ABCB family ABC transporter ATP-binding protein/permease [Polynucleobacter asymbioticus]|jgi:ATP-binding cassette subfamily B protein|uniref:ABC transporter related protein n=2 Tax=Polynucleobacter asymbioticus TaxID=576611 RepID=A4T038_POLAQ|nr:ABC transporter ATP-binding protein/permease [Polynucleobacter asymbioticus]ABP35102.1 ABC transporter related protein [Polynucleobacter asymbioticus QLW-P1DMWA-1]APB99761.1 metal ABC transporter permease [Polynucleobacter asymbioticus]APC02058.1 metal ABC transporter permease [Polynucleobacter asymbioticus]APC06868.1 metal ABC transporter permease [Polynucleobacter asymbioticus]
MRHSSGHHHRSTDSKTPQRGDWRVIRDLLPYLLEYRFRVIIALSCLIAAKVVNLGIPIVMKELIDALDIKASSPQALLVVPLGIIFAYGLLRISASLFTELREALFAKVTQNAVRKVALQVFEHLHSLALSFHLARQTGGVSRDIERGTRGIQSLISYSLYSILPTLIEFCLVLGYFAYSYDIWFAAITLAALVLYIAFTIVVTEWRTHYRRTMNDMDSKANQKAIDSLLNFETVKYFGNEAFEAGRYDENLLRYQAAAVKSQKTLAFLNLGQQIIIATGLMLILWRATVGVVNGTMTLGDLVLVNTLMIQLYIPLNFLGVIYREIKQSLTDMDRMFSLLNTDKEIADSPDAKSLQIQNRGHGPDVRFEHVSFHYEAKREILRDISFNIPAGTITAVVGQSGAGKSTLARLLFRFYDVQSGEILIDGQNIQDVTQASLRKAIGIVPQDTVLFNDTIGYNIAYGDPSATIEEVQEAARAAQIDGFIKRLPDGYDTQVGERGLKLSGGEKQRVAIARTLLKKPAMLIFDEATSALDSKTERAFQEELLSLAKNRTTLIIAHRLSTIIHADQILVMEHGQIVERGTHMELLAAQGRYAEMWQMQERATLD